MFRYQACPDIKGSESGVERAECIARYKDDRTRARAEMRSSVLSRGLRMEGRIFLYYALI